MLEEDEHECHNNSSYSKGEGLVCWKHICMNAEACYTPDDQIVECNMSIDDDRVKARASTFLYFYFVDKLIEVVFTIILALFPLLFHVFLKINSSKPHNEEMKNQIEITQKCRMKR